MLKIQAYRNTPTTSLGGLSPSQEYFVRRLRHVTVRPDPWKCFINSKF